MKWNVSAVAIVLRFTRKISKRNENAQNVEAGVMYLDLKPPELSKTEQGDGEGDKSRGVFIRRTVAVFEMIGGLLGVVIILHSLGLQVVLVLSGVVGPVWLLVSILFLILYLLCLVAGLLLWKKDARGVILSKLIQALQITQLTTAGFSYQFVAGFGVTLFIASTRLGIEFQLPSLDVGRVSQSEPFSLGVNIIALFIFAYLFKGRPKGQKQTN